MVCPAILTGTRFLATTLAHIDCQGRVIGAYGYGALADPGSPVALMLTGLLTIFVAFFGVRLMLGYPMTGRDVIGDVMRVGLMLTLATSWPAWRVVGYDLVMDGPAEIARTIGLASDLPGSDGGMVQRLQNADDGLVAMTIYATGRLTGGVVGGSDMGHSFQGIAIADETGFGWGRIFFLVGTIGPYAITRLMAGLLLAVAPLMAGLLLFDGTVGLFAGWLRGLVFTALGALSLIVIEGVELAVLEPWITDVLAQRGATTFTPSAPTELVVLAMAFAVASYGVLLVIAWTVFHLHMPGSRIFAGQGRMSEGAQRAGELGQALVSRNEAIEGPLRAKVVADAVAATMRREEVRSLTMAGSASERQDARRGDVEQLSAGAGVGTMAPVLGDSFRRTHRRESMAGQKRDSRA